MSDLISRKEVIKKLKEKSIVDEVNIISTTYTYKELVNIICNLPTSFDIKKVVAELKKESYEIRLEGGALIDSWHSVIDKNKAIDIVRKGGAE